MTWDTPARPDRRTTENFALSSFIRNFSNNQAAMNLWGETYTDDCFSSMQNPTQSGIVLARFSSLEWGGPFLVQDPPPMVLAHEIGHFLMNNYPGEPGPGEHHGAGPCQDPDASYIMHRVSCPQAALFSPGECAAMTSNTEENGFFLEVF